MRKLWCYQMNIKIKKIKDYNLRFKKYITHTHVYVVKQKVVK